MSGSFDYGAISGTLGRATSTSESNLRNFTQTMDAGSSADLIKLQNLTQQWSLAVNLESTTVKTIGDALKSVAQKIG